MVVSWSWAFGRNHAAREAALPTGRPPRGARQALSSRAPKDLDDLEPYPANANADAGEPIYG
jgi:hypothetical protein